MSNYKNIFAQYVDKFGYIGNRKGREIEVGDSCQRMGMVMMYENIRKVEILPYRNDAYMATELLHPPRRHPNHNIWEGQAGSLSRDNALPMICANSYYAKKISGMLLRRFGFFWNYKNIAGEVKMIPITDFAGPTVWGAIIRSAGWWWLYPFLIITDLILFVKSIFRVIYSKLVPTHTTDELNTQVMLAQADSYLQTPFSLLANFFYFRFGPKWALHSYFRKRSDMTPPPIYLLYTNDLFLEKWRKNGETAEEAKKRGVRL